MVEDRKLYYADKKNAGTDSFSSKYQSFRLDKTDDSGNVGSGWIEATLDRISEENYSN